MSEIDFITGQEIAPTTAEPFDFAKAYRGEWVMFSDGLIGQVYTVKPDFTPEQMEELFPGWIEAVANITVPEEFLAPIPESQPLPPGMYYSDPNTLADPNLEALEKRYGQPIPVSELDIQPGSAFDSALQTYIATGTQPAFGFPDPTGNAPEQALQRFIESFG